MGFNYQKSFIKKKQDGAELGSGVDYGVFARGDRVSDSSSLISKGVVVEIYLS